MQNEKREKRVDKPSEAQLAHREKFKKAVAKAKELMAENPELRYKEAIKKAFTMI